PPVNQPEEVPAPPPNPNGEVLMAIGQLVNLLTTFIQNQQAPAHAPPPAASVHEATVEVPAPHGAQPHQELVYLPPPPPRPYRSSLPDFIKSNRYFEGEFGKPDEAEDWLAQVERSFAAYEVPHHLRLSYGTYMLRLHARTWWDSKSRMLPAPITWEMFRQE